MMATTASSVQRLYDPIRKLWVAATPEEKVRQSILKQMLELGYPESLIAVEKAELPGRRVDILVYQKTGDELQPFLLVECKAHPLTQAVLNQVIGYNHHIQAPYIAIANQHEVRSGWFDGSVYRFKQGIPVYETD